MNEPESPVESYSGHTYAEEPRFVTWRGQRLAVTTVIARWRTPAGPTFRVRTESGMVFDLSYREDKDSWDVESGPDNEAV